MTRFFVGQNQTGGGSGLLTTNIYNEPMSTLSIVGTPIGNLEDITLRALRILRSAEIILCEDTRITKGLLFHYEITGKTLWAYDEHTHNQVFPRILESLQRGAPIALVSDAGMPGISDPGSYLVSCLRVSAPECIIEVIGGITALATAVAWSGVDTSEGFIFVGFIPHKKGRETLFGEILTSYSKRPVVAYESSHRIIKTVGWFNDQQRPTRITLCREMTKLHEECVTGSPSEILTYLQQPHKTKGEFVVIWHK
jgi:16S rRNA (cytidine1402-2'-O)-methyltransferase